MQYAVRALPLFTKVFLSYNGPPSLLTSLFRREGYYHRGRASTHGPNTPYRDVHADFFARNPHMVNRRRGSNATRRANGYEPIRPTTRDRCVPGRLLRHHSGLRRRGRYYTGKRRGHVNQYVLPRRGLHHYGSSRYPRGKGEYARDTGDSLVVAGDTLVYLAEVRDAAAEPTEIIVVT